LWFERILGRGVDDRGEERTTPDGITVRCTESRECNSAIPRRSGKETVAVDSDSDPECEQKSTNAGIEASKKRKAPPTKQLTIIDMVKSKKPRVER
jgi:hypothetical protein